MTYLQKNALRNMIAAGVMIVAGFCFQWIGLALHTIRVDSALMQVIGIENEWTHPIEIFVSLVYSEGLRWWDLVSGVNNAWIIFSIAAVFFVYRFLSTRLTGLMTIALLVATCIFRLPLYVADKIKTDAMLSGGRFEGRVMNDPGLDFFPYSSTYSPHRITDFVATWETGITNMFMLSLSLVISIVILLIISQTLHGRSDLN